VNIRGTGFFSDHELLIDVINGADFVLCHDLNGWGGSF